MKALIFIILAICLGFVIYHYGTDHKVEIKWLSRPGTTEIPESVKTDTDIHDAVNFVK